MARVPTSASMMPGGFKYVPNPAFMREFAVSPIISTAVGLAAKAASDKAIEIAPVDDGEFQAGIKSDTYVKDGGVTAGRVLATDWRSGWIEFGTRNTPAHATLRRACEAVGLKVRGGRRYKWRPSSRGGWY